MAQQYNIIIAGAGMVGACAALALSKQGFRIALLEPNEIAWPAKREAEYDIRVSAISPTSQQILSQLGVWQSLDHSRVCDYEKMSVWHQPGKARVDFDCVELARENLGSIVENREVLRALHSLCESQSRIDWFSPDRVDVLEENSAQGLSIKLASGVSLDADLLIAADGRGSPTRKLAEIEVTTGDYRQHAIVANVNTEQPHSFTAWQRFLKTGPLAFLPLANGQSSIVWSCDNELGEEMMQLDDEAFCVALGEAFELQLGKVTGIGERRSFPLGWHSCEQWFKHRVLLIGDAAHGVHPLAGQGVNLGFSDVALLSEKLADIDQCWQPKRLRQFERQRKSETMLATHAFGGLKWLYGEDNPALDQLRDLGMRLVQNNPVGKRLLMQQALRNMA